MAMNEDGIEFLGFNAPSIPVSGISLHIESPPSTLTFRKTHSPSVEIGRLPGPDAPGKLVDGDDKKALFRCPVVSRRHAKIAFSDSGFAYIIDLGSHHGTYLNGTKLDPEVPMRLVDGATLTLGKPVGRGVDFVRPVAVRVQLLHEEPRAVSTGGSGRYGVVESESDSASGSDVWSDVEEIPDPRTPLPLSLLAKSPAESQEREQSSLGKALEVLKKLMPPTHTPFSHSLSPIPQQQQMDFSTPAQRDSPVPSLYSPAYSPNWTREYDGEIEKGYFPEIEYYDELENESKSTEPKDDEKKDKDETCDCPSPTDSNMDLETPTPASRASSKSPSPSEQQSTRHELDEEEDEESISTSFDPFASFHVPRGKDWICSPAVFESLVVGDGDDVTTTANGGGYTSAPAPAPAPASIPPLPPIEAPAPAPTPPTANDTNKVVEDITMHEDEDNEDEVSEQDEEEEASDEDEDEDESNTLPPIKSAPAGGPVRALPSLSKMRFMGMSDVLCEASVWKFGRREEVAKVEVVVKEKEVEEEKEEGKEEKEIEKESEKEEEKEEDDKMAEDDPDIDAEGDLEIEPSPSPSPTELTALRTDLTKIHTDLHKLNTHRRKYKFRFNANVRAVEDKFSSVYQKLSSLAPVGDLKALKDEVAGLNREVSLLSDRIADLREDIEEEGGAAREEMGAAREDLVSARAEIEHALDGLSGARDEISDIVADLGFVSSKVEVVRKEVEGVKSSSTQVNSTIEELQSGLCIADATLRDHESLIAQRHDDATSYTDTMVGLARAEVGATACRVERIEGRLADVEGRMMVVERRVGVWDTRAVEERVCVLEARVDTREREGEVGEEGRVILAEMRQLRDEMKRQMEVDLQSVKEAARVCSQSSLSMKRKRDDESSDSSDSSESPSNAMDLTPDSTTVSVNTEPPRKRAKTQRIVNVLAQSATAITLGAVAAWTALAFT